MTKFQNISDFDIDNATDDIPFDDIDYERDGCAKEFFKRQRSFMLTVKYREWRRLIEGKKT